MSAPNSVSSAPAPWLDKTFADQEIPEVTNPSNESLNRVTNAPVKVGSSGNASFLYSSTVFTTARPRRLDAWRKDRE
jgi:hypothetical protein